MAPFNEAIKSISKIGQDFYEGEIDPDYAIGSVTHGGYLLAQLTKACVDYQKDSKRLDPIHVTAHYLRPTSPSLFQIKICVIKSGKQLTYLSAELMQDERVNVMAHFIFGVFTSDPPAGPTLPSSSAFARKIPLHDHPSLLNDEPISDSWGFSKHITWAADRKHDASNNIPKTSHETVGGGGLEWAAYVCFQSERDEITSPALSFLGDLFVNLPSLLPESEKQQLGITTSAFPTIVLSLEFKAEIPPPSSIHAKRTVGVYSVGNFLNNGRHETRVEVWSSPCEVGMGAVTPGWRNDQVCLAIANQVALTVPAA